MREYGPCCPLIIGSMMSGRIETRICLLSPLRLLFRPGTKSQGRQGERAPNRRYPMDGPCAELV